MRRATSTAPGRRSDRRTARIVSVFVFGRLADGREVRAASLTWPGGLSVDLLEYGAAVHGIAVPTPRGTVQAILRHDTLADYEADTAYLGPVVGRCANRISGARFDIDGQAFDVCANEGPNCLHGGDPGFNKRLWRIAEPVDPVGRSATLTYVSPDGEEGFPGRVEVSATFTLIAADTLEIVYEASTGAPTPVNLSQHLYFNLSGDPGRDILDHVLEIGGATITPVRPDLVPTGERLAVDATPFDLRRPRRIGDALAETHPQLVLAKGFDHNWALDPQVSPSLRLRSPETGLALEIETDQPGMQVYSGQGLEAPYLKHGAMVFEPQGFPDAVNQPGFPDVVLRPGQTYRHRSTYRFRTDPAD